MVLHLGYDEVIAGVKDLGLESFELGVGRELKSGVGLNISTKEERKEVTRRLRSEGVHICALLVANDFAKEDVKAEIKWVVDACRAASALGVDVVRIDVPHQMKTGTTLEDYARLTARCVQQVIDETKDLDVSLGMENHGRIGNNREFIEGVLNAVKSERMGLTLDSGNFYWYGYPLDEVYTLIESFAPYVKHTHIKNLSFSRERRQVRRTIGEDYPKTAAPLYQGDIDLKRVVNVLKKTGYDKDLTIEDESLGNFPPEQRLGIIRKDVEHLKSLI